MGAIDDRKAGTEKLEGRADGTIRERRTEEFDLNSLWEVEAMVVRVAADSIWSSSDFFPVDLLPGVNHCQP